MFTPVKPVTHCWCAVEEPPGFSGKEGCPGGTGSSRATPGALSHPKCLWELPGPSCPSSMELPWNSFPWLCPGPAAQGVGLGVPPAPCPWFWGHSVTSVVLRSDSRPLPALPDLPVSLQWGYWPSWWGSAGVWNVIIAAVWEIPSPGPQSALQIPIFEQFVWTEWRCFINVKQNFVP